jgi:hypothetical protein
VQLYGGGGGLEVDGALLRLATEYEFIRLADEGSFRPQKAGQGQ